jgi:hypothetical protein
MRDCWTSVQKRAVQFIALIFILSAGCGGGGTTSPPSPGPLTFAPVATTATGGDRPGSVALGDFNGDGKLDIAISNFRSGSISVFLNKGDGTFQAPIVSFVQVSAFATGPLGPLAVGDFNQDGKPDLVVASVGGLQADIVLLGNGDGTFRQLAPIPNSYPFFHARVVDLNGDGHQDLVTSTNGPISVFMGNGDGTFTAAPALVTPPGCTPGIFPCLIATPYLGIAVGDFNGDKKLDIVACNPGSFLRPSPAGNLVFYAGNGDGTFQAPTVVPLSPSQPSALAAADFQGNGKLDLMIGYPNMAAITHGNGDGSFQLGLRDLVQVYSTPDFILNSGVLLQVADFNMDGKPDALVGDPHLGVVSLVLNDAIGRILPPTGTQFQFNLAPGISDMAVGDLNGDGYPDIVVVNIRTNEISIILSQRH